jgi:PAS domain S-box-containing protein
MKSEVNISAMSRAFRKLASGVLASIALSLSPSRGLPQQFYFHQYTGDEGLSQLVGQAMFQDRDGYIWIGTQAGLNRYDGNMFEIFSIRQGLPNDWINAIAQDSSGAIWVATNGGLSRYQNRSFQNFSESDGLLDSRVLALAVDRHGYVWCGTRGGLCKWDGSEFQDFRPIEGLPHAMINALLFDNNDRLWIGSNVGLFYWEGNQFSKFPSEGVGENEILALTRDRQDRIWVGLQNRVVAIQGNQVIANIGKAQGLQGLPTKSLAVCKHDDLWVGLENGFAVIGPDEIRFLGAENGFPLADARSILMDREGYVWFGGLGGVAKFRGRGFTNYTKADGLASNIVRSILRDRNGALWVATSAGLNQYNTHSWQHFTTKDGLDDDYIWTLFEDSDGRMWAGSNKGLNYSDDNQFQVIHDDKPYGRVTSIGEDHDGNLWFTARERGLCQLSDLQIQAVDVPEQTFSNGRLLIARDGKIWVSGDHGLSMWDGQDWTTFTTDHGLPDEEPYSITEDHRGNLWFGYHSSNGVTRYDGANFKTYTTEDGLFNDAVYSIGVDHNNHLWFGTARGVDRFDGETFINYGKIEGYASYESNAGAFFADNDSTLWFGTAEGLSHYDPRFELNINSPLRPRIHSVVSEDQAVAGDTLLVLPYSASDLTVRIAPLSYVNSQRLSFRYRLLGQSEDWKPLEGYVINYAHLRPGHYTLEIQGRKYRQGWSEPVTMRAVIKPPFWETWWFWTTASLLLIAWTIGLFKYRVFKIQSRNRWLEHAIETRTTELRQKNHRLASALTKHKQAERALKDSEKRLRDFFESSPDAIIVEDLDGNVLDVNPAACDLHLMDRERLIGRNVRDLVPPDHSDEVAQNTADLATGKLTHFESRILRENDQDVPVEVRASQISHSGRPALLLHVTDISERKRVEEELNALNRQLLASEQQLSSANQQLMASFEELKTNEIMLRDREERIRLIIDTAHDAVITMDSSGIITAWNKQAEIIFGWSHEEAIGQNLSETIMPMRYRERHVQGIERFLDSGQSQICNRRIELAAQHRDGFEFPVELSVSPLKLGESYIFSAFVRDITDRKKAETELQQAKEEAEAASRSKSEFLANMSHEIRTPLNAIIGMTELILDTKLNEEQTECLKVVQSSSESLLNLINDILDFSKIEAGQMELEEIAFELREVVETVTDIVRVRAEAKNIELLCYVDPGLPSWVVGDKTRLQQILINLVGNAIKFTEGGEVSIKAEPAKMSGEDNLTKQVGVHFRVSDTGIGISEDHQKKIFEKFSQADSSTTRRFGGTGLGLSISKFLVEMMDGRLGVESELGEGSTFQFTLSLPVADAKDEDIMSSQTKDFSNTSVLVVDDNQTNRFILQRTLSAWGSEVREAESGAEALAILDGRTTHFDLIILDHQMPEMDGLQVAQAVRAKDIPDPKLILLSSWGSPGQQLRDDLRIAYTMIKPVKQSKLLEVLKYVLFREDIAESPPAKKVFGTESDRTGQQMTILLAEDNPDNQNLARRILEKANYNVDIASTGKLAVEMAIKFQYALILMDIQMPGMDGFAATKEIRALEQIRGTERVPIVALTAHALKGYRERCLKHDMDDFITKPLKKKLLFETVAKWIDQRPTILIKANPDDSVKAVPQTLLNDEFKVVFKDRLNEVVEFFGRHDISMVLVDIETGKDDGYHAMSAIRALESGGSVPIVALTPDEDLQVAEKVRELGVSEIVTKPLQEKKLKEVISKFLGEPVRIEEET